jgi:deoxyribodipyrimidine photo-lyase
MEYEVDELRRDIEVLQLGGKAKSKVRAMFVHDRLAVPPGTLKTGQGKPYGVFTPFSKKWQAFLDANPEHLYEAADPEANEEAVRSHPVYGRLFDNAVPDYVEGFRCPDHELMNKIWPEGTESAIEVLNRFLYCSARKSDLGLVDPRTQGEERSTNLDSDDEMQVVEETSKTKGKKGIVDGGTTQSRLRDYASSRNSADSNTSSRMSPYLASGVISIRMVLNKIKKLLGNKLESGRDSGAGTWVMECVWRDFYNNVSSSGYSPCINVKSYIEPQTGGRFIPSYKHGSTLPREIRKRTVGS